MYFTEIMPQGSMRKPIFQRIEFSHSGIIANLPERRFWYKAQKSAFNILYTKILRAT
jgi:hypothetical protein